LNRHSARAVSTDSIQFSCCMISGSFQMDPFQDYGGLQFLSFIPGYQRQHAGTSAYLGADHLYSGRSSYCSVEKICPEPPRTPQRSTAIYLIIWVAGKNLTRTTCLSVCATNGASDPLFHLLFGTPPLCGQPRTWLSNSLHAWIDRILSCP
jgi:hypothetical protein